ncbi:C-type lectin-like [Podarcis raffonei]|uniref:C-type lectin-like n=1 Tax=Podarcis raffonei TaxID=65483 RepID=UPI002329172D|nr:C-type lectin-like [Podarcis raffonei]
MGVVTYLCLLGLLVSYSFPGARARYCSRGWLRALGNCYAYFDSPKSWSEAEIACQSHGRGTHLASILTEQESALVAKYISSKQKRKYNVWIGLYDPYENRDWKWLDDSIFNYSNWNGWEPNNSGGKEYCVELKRSTGFRKWNDKPCHHLCTYICKQEI